MTCGDETIPVPRVFLGLRTGEALPKLPYHTQRIHTQPDF